MSAIKATIAGLIRKIVKVEWHKERASSKLEIFKESFPWDVQEYSENGNLAK